MTTCCENIWMTISSPKMLEYTAKIDHTALRHINYKNNNSTNPLLTRGNIMSAALVARLQKCIQEVKLRSLTNPIPNICTRTLVFTLPHYSSPSSPIPPRHLWQRQQRKRAPHDRAIRKSDPRIIATRGIVQIRQRPIRRGIVNPAREVFNKHITGARACDRSYE